MAAISLRKEIGIEGPDELSLEDVIIGRGGYVRYQDMGKVDGRIFYGDKISTIFINSTIKYEGRRRFALAHELGHLEMHKDMPIHDDNVSLNWFSDMETKLKTGNQEYEANQFATEYLMPIHTFIKKASGKKLSPQLLSSLANEFNTSLTSVTYRYLEADLYPMALIYVYNGLVRYWKKSSDLNVYIVDRIKMAPPEDSIAMEYIKADYMPIYVRGELKQSIEKSTWFKMREDEKDREFFEYCIVTQAHKSILSVIWEH